MEQAVSSRKKSREKDITNGAESTTAINETLESANATVDSINSTQIQRHFTFSDKDVWDSVEWSRRDARAGNFFQADVEFPTSWSDSAVGIVSKLYFATVDGVRESSLKTLIERVFCKIAKEGLNFNYFGDENDLEQLDKLQVFKEELTYILLHQYAAFNSPVWFNFGVNGRKQCGSACFILNVEDHMFGDDSITEWISNESRIFKGGSGAGVNLSKLRGSMEPLSTGGISSGPISFMRVADANCGAIKAGNTRRGAKVIQLDVDHPDILDFIDSKVREDKKIRVLTEAGFNMDPSTVEGEKNIAESTSFQNANISVRLSDKFMEAVENDGSWILTERTTGYIVKQTIPARELLNNIAEATWQCADPGISFDDTINNWHTTPSLGKIEASNPCMEYHSNNNSACNLASLNLVKFLNDDNSFAFDDFYQAVDVMITAMDITCSFSEMPTKKIEDNVRNLRQLGLGYSNLGAALMIQGMPYDSDEGRDWAASVTSLMTGRAYRRSAELASQLGPFLHYKDNSFVMKEVLFKHQESISSESIGKIWGESEKTWSQISNNSSNGFRNSQISVLAPTGTISFMMDCDTTGCEPAYSLVSYKKLAAGGSMTLVNKSVARSLENQGFLRSEIKIIEEDGLSHPIFYSPQFQTAAGNNSISPDGHIKMLAAIQPHLSGAISKTVNLPESATVEDIYNLYIEAWKLGIKCVAVYRDGSKSTQVLSTKKDSGTILSETQKQINESLVDQERFNIAQYSTEDKTSENVEQNNPSPPQVKELETWKKRFMDDEDKAFNEMAKRSDTKIIGKGTFIDSNKIPSRKKMPQERKSITNKFSIGEYEGYITAGMYEDGTLGEIFLNGIGKEGSTLRGVMDALAMSISIGLQHGVPLETLAQKFSHMDFEPKGLTNNPEIRVAKSMPDYIMRWLVSKFGDDDLCEELGIRKLNKFKDGRKLSIEYDNKEYVIENSLDRDIKENGKSNIDHALDHGKACVCGSLMNRVGTCWSCRSCGASTGCS